MKRLLIILVVIAALGAAVAVYIWNKPHATVEGKNGIAMTADSLANAFSTDEQLANERFLNEIIEVSGVVWEINENQDRKTVITLSVTDPLSGVQCTMKDPAKNIKKGDVIRVKGFCNGFTLTVLLSDCIIL
jgi:hypothetical protein